MESEQNKSEQATPYKLKKSREQGQVAKSMETNAILSLAAFLLVSFVLFSSIASGLKLMTVNVFNSVGNLRSDGVLMTHIFTDSLTSFFSLMTPVFAVLILIALASNFLQIGFNFTLIPLKPNFKKINPAKNIKNIFSKKTVFELIKVLLKICGFVIVFIITSDFLIDQLVSIVQMPYSQFTEAWQTLFFKLALTLLLILAGIAFIDFMFNKQDFRKKMMMSKSEVKQEYKNREGDPEIKAKRKQNQKELLEKTASLSDVKNADLVIINPIHIAIALQFDKETMLSPQVIAIGQGELAEHIRNQARLHRVPLIRNINLARLLYQKLKLNHFVPSELFKEVAPVYQWLYKTQGITRT